MINDGVLISKCGMSLSQKSLLLSAIIMVCVLLYWASTCLCNYSVHLQSFAVVRKGCDLCILKVTEWNQVSSSTCRDTSTLLMLSGADLHQAALVPADTQQSSRAKADVTITQSRLDIHRITKEHQTCVNQGAWCSAGHPEHNTRPYNGLVICAIYQEPVVLPGYSASHCLAAFSRFCSVILSRG